MHVKESVKEEIISAISSIGSGGATIAQIEKKVSFERHTLSKYLSFLQGHGTIYHQMYGKAKVWFINNAPIKTLLNSLPESKTLAEKALYGIVSSLPSGLIVINENYDVLFSNEMINKLYGLTEGQKLYSVWGYENPLKLKQLADIIWGKLQTARFEATDASGRTFAIRATKFQNPDKTSSIILIVNDITLQKKSEETIQEQKALLEAERETLNNSAIVSEADLAGNIIYANDKFCEISKYKRSELLGKNHRIINSGHHPKEFFRSMWKTISSGKVWKGEIKNRAKDGTFYWVDSAIAPVLGKNAKPVKYISIRFDITELKKAKEKQREGFYKKSKR